MAEETKQRRRWRFWAAILVILVLAALMYWPVRGPIRISPQTTVVDGPLNEDGTVNYVAALNSSCAQGVTAENNAAIPLLHALGVEPVPSRARESILATLGVKLDPSARRFVTWGTWLAARQAVSVPVETQPSQTHPAETQGGWEGPATRAAEAAPALGEALDRLRAGQDVPQVQQWVADNAEPLDHIVAATNLPRHFMPLVSPSTPPRVGDAQLPELTRYREAAMALSARAELRARAGQVEAAWQDVLAIHRLARLIARGPTLIEQLVAIAAERMGAKAGASVATSGRCTAEQAKAMLVELAKLPPVGDVAGSIDRCERFMVLDYLMVLYRGDTVDGLDGGAVRWVNVDWNEVLASCNGLYDRVAAVARIGDPAARAQANQALSRPVEARQSGSGRAGVARFLLLLAGGRITQKARSQEFVTILAGMLLPSLGKVADFQDAARTATEIEKVSLALAAYRAENARLPDRLEALSPAYLPSVPPDKFSGRALVYRPTEKGYLLYSVGVNRRDDGGVENRKEEKDDIIVQAK